MAFKSLEEFWSLSRYHNEQNVLTNNVATRSDSLLTTAKSGADVMTRRWRLDLAMTDAPGEGDLKGSLRTFWFNIMLAIKHSQTIEQIQNIVDYLRHLKESVGPLSRHVLSDGSPLPLIEGQDRTSPTTVKRVDPATIPGTRLEYATTREGTVWIDLPYLEKTLLKAIMKIPPITPIEQWIQLHRFAAHLTSDEVHDLSFFAIWAFFDCLEAFKYLVPQTPKESDTATLRDIFPIVRGWLDIAGDKIIDKIRKKNVPDDIAARYDMSWYRDGVPYVGLLAVEGGVSEAGFSRKRWDFWKKRLQQIEQEAAESTTTESVGEQARACLKLMLELEVNM